MKTPQHSDFRWNGQLHIQGTLLIVTWLWLVPSAARADDLMPLLSPVSLEAEAQTAPKSPPIKTSMSPQPPVHAAPIADLQSQKERRFRELKRQMEMLSQLGPSSSAPVEQAAPEAIEEGSRDVPDVEHHEHVRPSSQEHPGQSYSTPQEYLEKSPSPHLVPAEQEVSGHDAPAGPAIVEGTIDRFALATSLFGTGQAETCLDVFKHTDLTQLTREDQIWAEYMHACCQRKTGHLDLARQSYRRILAEKDADWIAQLATWWLNDLESKDKLKTDAQRLSETLAAWEIEIDKLAEQSTRATADQ